jgi:hypothetical protein
MASNFKRPVRSGSDRVSYELLARFSELLICGRCFSRNVLKPVPQVLSSRHKPLAICHECSRKLQADHQARVLQLN